jgi:hypothetical protein
MVFRVSGAGFLSMCCLLASGLVHVARHGSSLLFLSWGGPGPAVLLLSAPVRHQMYNCCGQAVAKKTKHGPVCVVQLNFDCGNTML